MVNRQGIELDTYHTFVKSTVVVVCLIERINLIEVKNNCQRVDDR